MSPWQQSDFTGDGPDVGRPPAVGAFLLLQHDLAHPFALQIVEDRGDLPLLLGVLWRHFRLDLLEEFIELRLPFQLQGDPQKTGLFWILESDGSFKAESLDSPGAGPVKGTWV